MANVPPTHSSDSAQELKKRALRLLMQREHTRTELAVKLAPHAESREAVDALLNELERRRQLSDERYAESRIRVLSRKYGAARIRLDLKGKGVASGIAEQLVAAVGASDLERAQEILRRKYREAATTRKERAKRARFLQSRGFSLDVIRQLLKGVNVD